MHTHKLGCNKPSAAKATTSVIIFYQFVGVGTSINKILPAGYHKSFSVQGQPSLISLLQDASFELNLFKQNKITL
jgi:hypothetical protein